ncbi:hypothetical protein [Streptomyces narbonensis]|uniref:hypothetical protein n=1 Tax=Streptomyces narbonensis TaxID=67333 RepID=UPI003402C202
MAGIEPDLAEEAVRQAIAEAAASRAKRSRLARALTDDPALLTSGRPEGPRVIGDFARALLTHGSRRAVLPKCAACSSTKKLTSLRDDGKRICQSCDHKSRAASLSCVECSRPARVYRRTRTGEAICRNCWRLPDGDPVVLITAAVTSVAQDADPAAVRRVVQSIAPVGNVYVMFRLLWEIEDTPGLLTGEGAKASARVARLITALSDAGVSVTVPACSGCREVRPLEHVFDGLRCCYLCYRKAHSTACGHCGHDGAVASRRPDGTPLCSSCTRYEADRVTTCVLCDLVLPVGRRTKDGAALSCMLPADVADLLVLRQGASPLLPGRDRHAPLRHLLSHATHVCGLRQEQVRPRPHRRRPPLRGLLAKGSPLLQPLPALRDDRVSAQLRTLPQLRP